MLKDILDEIVTDYGFEITSEDSRAYVVDKINKAAEKYLYDIFTPWGTEREEVMFFDKDFQQVTLPWYVDTPMAVRDVDYVETADIVGKGPRYKYSIWARTPWNIRVRRVSATNRDIQDILPVRIRLQDDAEEAQTITIIGKTPSASRKEIQLTVAEGARLSSYSSVAFSHIDSILRSEAATNDCTIENANGETLAEFPNHLLKTRFLLCQISDFNDAFFQDRMLEVLFKHVYVPVKEDNDQFFWTDIYDRVVYLMACSILASKDEKKIALAPGYMESARNLYVEVETQARKNEKNKLELRRDPIQLSHETSRRNWMLDKDRYLRGNKGC